MRRPKRRRAGCKNHKENDVKAHRAALLGLGLATLISGPALADGFNKCTTVPKASWKPQADAEALAKAAGYEVRRSKIEGTCYEVYGVKDGKLFELFYSPADLKLMHTKAK